MLQVTVNTHIVAENMHALFICSMLYCNCIICTVCVFVLKTE